MNSVEDAYDEIAKSLLWFVADDEWSLAKAKSSIWSQSTQTSLCRLVREREISDDKFPDTDMIIACAHSVLYLRDDLLRTTGARIWGLTFTLYPNGKFNLEYDYNKPEGYEETDDIITGDEMNASLNLLSGKAID